MPQPQKQKSNDNNRDTESGGRRIEKKTHTHEYDFCIFTQDNLHTASQAGDCTRDPGKGMGNGRGKG